TTRLSRRRRTATHSLAIISISRSPGGLTMVEGLPRSHSHCIYKETDRQEGAECQLSLDRAKSSAQNRTATMRKPMWSARRSGSNRNRKADRQGQPSSAQHPPLRTLDKLPVRLRAADLSAAYKSGSTPPGSFAWYQSRHHSKTLPCTSCNPHRFGG